MPLVQEFTLFLRQRLKSEGVGVQAWPGAGRRSPNLIKLDTRPKATVLYAKESSSSPAFWGLTKNQIARLDGSGNSWFAVFLAGGESGYLLTGGQVRRRIESGLFELSGDGDYKVNETTDFEGGQKFSTFRDLAQRVI